jgi:DNA-binding cell septation regulator SpoVG
MFTKYSRNANAGADVPGAAVVTADGKTDRRNSTPTTKLTQANRAGAIVVRAIRRLDGSTTVKAFVDIQLGGLVLKGCKIVQQDGQRAWLAMPSVKTERAWLQVVEVESKALRDRFTDVVLQAWEAGR